jgi:hypothetical protein
MPGNGESADHRGSHRGLLASPPDVAIVPQAIDAVFVPTARRPVYLIEAARLSVQLRCPLVTLHSGRWTSSVEAFRRLRHDVPEVDLIAIDVPARALLQLPDWATSRLVAGTVFARKSDLSTKRNLALMLSWLIGWDRILFLDDDITQLDPTDMERASGLLENANVVGLQVTGFPDHSVVCHAFRQAGGDQEAFIGGGAMAVAVGRSNAFYPDIYNDDWFFMLDEDGGLQAAATTGQVRQYPYDPFRNSDRARAEEFGDVLAEGIFCLLDQGQTLAEAGEEYWAKFLAKRQQFIQRVLDMVKTDPRLDPEDRQRRITALSHGSMFRLAKISPGLCAAYLKAWGIDREQWQRHLKDLPRGLKLNEVLSLLARADGAPLVCHRTESRRSPERTSLMPSSATPANIAAILGTSRISDQLAASARAGIVPPIRVPAAALSQEVSMATVTSDPERSNAISDPTR